MPTAERNKKYHGMTKAEYERRLKIKEAGPFYKVLRRDSDGKLYSCSGGDKCWGDGGAFPGPWEEEGSVWICNKGLHVTNDPAQWDAANLQHETFEVEIPWTDKSVQITDLHAGEKIAVSKMRLMGLVDPLTLAAFGIVRGNVNLSYVEPHKGVKHFAIQSGVSTYHSSEARLFQIYGQADFTTSSYGALVRSFDQSTITAANAKVEHYSTGQLTAGTGSFCTVTNGTVRAMAGSTVIVTGGTPRIYAQGGSAIVLRAPAYVVKSTSSQEIIVASTSPSNLLKSNRLLAVTDKFGNFLKFVELESTIPSDAKIIL